MKIYTKEDLNNKEISEAFYSVIELEALDSVSKIIEDVKNNKNKALIEYSKSFNDGNFENEKDFLVSENEIEEAYNNTNKDVVESIKKAYKSVLEFAEKQFSCIKEFETKIGESVLGHKIIPLNRVLCYVPGGNYPLPSSCIMTVTPAKVAGVKEIYLTSPKIRPQTIVAAHIAGADKIYKLGGAQAISAFAYGTESILPVDKIVGPGNKYVTFAKKYVYGTCDIDFLAGPSEVLIVADETANPDLISADMLAQSEHDKDARSYLITTSKDLAIKVQKSAEKQLETLKTKEIAQIAFEKSSAIIVNSIDEAIEISNRRAPEHLELMFKDADKFKDKFINYGSLFVGENCAEVFGDYCSGTNHVLPTNMAARYTGGLSVFDFIKILTWQNIDKNMAKDLAKTASKLAEAEGLFAHKLASDLRSL